MAHIVVIEDEPTLLELLVLSIQSHGYEVTGVARASRALELVDQIRPDLIVLDVVMPPRELDGLQFLFHLRKKPTAADIPVIVVSGLANVINPHTAKHLGVRGLHLKPFETSELLAQIDAILKAA